MIFDGDAVRRSRFAKGVAGGLWRGLPFRWAALSGLFKVPICTFYANVVYL